MMEPTPLRDPNPQLFVQDFDALADLAQTLIDHERRSGQHERSFLDEMEFTTEWQMVPDAEMAHSV